MTKNPKITYEQAEYIMKHHWLGQCFNFLHKAFIIGQFIYCGYSFFTTIYFSVTLYNQYIYYANHSWCYYGMLVVLFSLFTVIAINQLFTFYMVSWVKDKYDINFNVNKYIFFYTGPVSSLTYCLYKSRENTMRLIWFLYWSGLKLVDFSIYTSSNLINVLVLSNGIMEQTGVKEYFSDFERYKQIERRLALLILFSLVFYDIPQIVITAYSLKENGELSFNLDFSNFGTLRNSASLNLIRILFSIVLAIHSLYSFISGYFCKIQPVFRSSQIEQITNKNNLPPQRTQFPQQPNNMQNLQFQNVIVQPPYIQGQPPYMQYYQSQPILVQPQAPQPVYYQNNVSLQEQKVPLIQQS